MSLSGGLNLGTVSSTDVNIGNTGTCNINTTSTNIANRVNCPVIDTFTGVTMTIGVANQTGLTIGRPGIVTSIRGLPLQVIQRLLLLQY